MTIKPRRTLKDLDQEIGAVAIFIRQQRKRLGYSQAEFADRVGVGHRFLRDLELGKKSARMDKVNQVLEFLGHHLVPGPISTEGER